MALGPSPLTQEAQGHRGPGWDEMQGQCQSSEPWPRAEDPKSGLSLAKPGDFGGWSQDPATLPGTCHPPQVLPWGPSALLPHVPALKARDHHQYLAMLQGHWQSSSGHGHGTQGQQREHRGHREHEGHRPVNGQLVPKLCGELISALRALR